MKKTTPKTEAQRFLFTQYEERAFNSTYDFIRQIPGIDAGHKILLDVMCNDVYLNSRITWSQSTYAKKTGTSRITINKHFKKFVELGIIIPDSNNKTGGKDKYDLNLERIKLLRKPVKPVKKSCKPQLTPTCKPQLTPTCKPQFTDIIDDNKNNIYNRDSEESSPFKGDSSSSQPKKGPTALELEIFARNLDF